MPSPVSVWWIGLTMGGAASALVGWRRSQGGTPGPLMPEARMYCTVGALLISLWLITYVIG